jgi:hypothetical protein
MARVLVACEFSGVVRRAFQALGHDAWSCDLVTSLDDSENHIVGDVRGLLDREWDLMIAHPPCTRLCNSGSRWLAKPPPGKTSAEIRRELRDGAALFSDLLNADIPRIAIENPVMHYHAKALIRNYRPFDQTFQPWMFGDPEKKLTCLWLKNLKPLRWTQISRERNHTIYSIGRQKNRASTRSVTFSGVAAAIADQWGSELG